MIKMEAELTALKEELSTRAKPNNGTETPEIAENEPTPEKSSSSSSVIKKTENNIKDESSEEKN